MHYVICKVLKCCTYKREEVYSIEYGGQELKIFPAIVGSFPTCFLVHVIKEGGRQEGTPSHQKFSSPSQTFDVSKSASSTRFVLTQIYLRFQFRFLFEKNSGEAVTVSTAAACNFYLKYRIIHKSLREFRTRLRNNQDRHGRKEHINR